MIGVGMKPHRLLAAGMYCLLIANSATAGQCEENKVAIPSKAELDKLEALATSGGVAAQAQIGSEGQYLLGQHYASNGKSESDFRKAVGLLRRSADQGCIPAAFALGVLTYGGKGVAKNTEEGFQLILKAAEAGNANAQLWVGMLLMGGSGAEKDTQAGFAWIKRAADSGDSSAEIALAAAYLEGTGTKRDPEATRSILESVYKKRDDQSSTAAAYLGWMYMDGQGVPVDNVKAFRWTIIAANENIPGSKERLRMLMQRMPENKLATACGVYMDASLASKEYWLADAGENVLLLSTASNVAEVFLPQRSLLGYVSQECLNM